MKRDELLKHTVESTLRTYRTVSGNPHAGLRINGLIGRVGAREAVRRAVLKNEAHGLRPGGTEGFRDLARLGRLDLSMEWLALAPCWGFDLATRQRAYTRLQAAYDKAAQGGAA